ncbi:MAG: hypothetical protein FWD17_13810, partial [Polyangiaceae bacterium]|nr:hypothetical protein [Polyangiaceae bacterium]
IHLTQLERKLVSELERKGLLSIDGEWARVKTPVAQLYQITMANEAAHQLFAAPVTENSACNVAATFFAAAKMAHDRASVGANGLLWAELYMPFPSIESVAPLSVKKLLELRTKYARKRSRFRNTVQRRAAVIATLPSVDAVRAHLESMAREMKDELEEQRDALRASGMRDAWSLIGMSSPLSLGAGALIGQVAAATALGAVGTVALGVGHWFYERRRRERNEGHYLLSLEREFDQKGMMSDFGRRMQRLIHGSA